MGADSEADFESHKSSPKRNSSVGKEQLVLFDLMLPANVMWFEMPIVCQWQESKNIWTTNYVFDVNQNPDSTIQFRTSNLWPIGFAQLRYINLPYQDWELKNDPSGKGVLFTLTGTDLKMTIQCRNRRLVLKEVSKTMSTILKRCIGHSMTVARFKHVMQEAGCDIFPEFDAHNYIDGTCIKTWVMEKHLYHAMAFLSRAYDFRFSKWNNQVGVRNILCQIREYADNNRENKFRLLYVSPESTTLLKNVEDMAEFNDESSMASDFYPDLLTLHLAYGSMDAQRTVKNMNYKLTETIFELLQQLKPCSFG